MLDLECPDGDADCLGTGSAGSAPAADIAARMWDWIHAVERATGARPLVYTFASYFASAGVDATGLDAYPLVLAQPSAGACFGVPAPWPRATLWQYSWSGRVAGIDVPVDRDRFLGSAAELATFAIDSAVDAAVEPAPEAGPIAAMPVPGRGALPGPAGCP
jgi:GH25 family lysozyme M1 (1,4-beta-N-acetylmuramidase)